jgi:DNA-directed RNA polymerase sigma subunit (sigma70/sigma32)
VSCRFHLYLDVKASGAILFNFPDKELWEMEHTCALDVAEKGGITLDEAGVMLGVTRTRIQQIERAAGERIRGDLGEAA